MDESFIDEIAAAGPSQVIPKVEPSSSVSPSEKEVSGSPSPNGQSSPEPNCPICLGKLVNKSFTDSCLHQFCFSCLVKWSKVKAECPLCKQAFKSIIHNVRSIEDYQQFYLPPPTPAVATCSIHRIYHEDNFPYNDSDNDRPQELRPAFRYRTTAVSTYLDYVVRLEQAMSSQVLPTLYPRRTRTARISASRQTGTSDFRRNIYQQGLWVQRLPDITGRVRESSPEFYRENPAMVHRLAPWLNRELNVVCGGPNTREILNNILDLITRVPIRSARFSSAVAPHIGRHTDHFVHEFYNFAISPYDLVGYDRHANYVNQDALAHLVPSEPSAEEDSDVQVVESVPAVAPPIPIQLNSDSDDCVVVDTVLNAVPNAVPNTVHTWYKPPEVITIDSEDEGVQVNIHINSDTAQAGPSSRNRPLKKRSWVSGPSTSESLNVSINIGCAGPSNLGYLFQNRRPSTSSSSSSSSWSPSSNKRAVKRKKNKKARISCKSSKGKVLKSKSQTKIHLKRRANNRPECENANESRGVAPPVYERQSSRVLSEDGNGCLSPIAHCSRRQSSVVLKSSSDNSERSPSPIIPLRVRRNSILLKTSSDEGEASYRPPTPPRRRRRPSIVLKTSSDDDSYVLRIDTDQDLTSSSEEDYKPRLRSVVVKSEVKPEPRSVSPYQSPQSENRFMDNDSESRNLDYDAPSGCFRRFSAEMSDSSDSSYRESTRRARRYSSSSSKTNKTGRPKYKKKSKRSK